GRGRGRGQMTFNVEAVGIGKGEALPPPTLQPPPLFPVLPHGAVPPRGGEDTEYMLALKQELRGAMRNLPYFVKPGAARRGATILVPKCHQQVTLDKEETIKKLEVRRLKAGGLEGVGGLSRVLGSPPARVNPGGAPLDPQSLEKKEEEVSSEEEEEKEEEEEGKEEEEEEYDEEEHEEETDYIMSYFDNGEDFGGDSDDNMDEAVY
ncbi:RPC7L polymerase, partial [Bucco capensis]|nr:RPC7L polymerase [Bucco capensis]